MRTNVTSRVTFSSAREISNFFSSARGASEGSNPSEETEGVILGVSLGCVLLVGEGGVVRMGDTWESGDEVKVGVGGVFVKLIALRAVTVSCGAERGGVVSVRMGVFLGCTQV